MVVQDANVLMDLINGGILDVWFRLGAETWTTDFVVAEIIRPDQQKAISGAIKRKRIHVSGSPPEGLPPLLALSETWSISIADASVLRTAQIRGAILMSGDGPLRRAASNEGVDIRGVLWALDELVAANELQPSDAAHSLKQILEAGSYLPKAEYQKRLRAWE